MKILHLYKTRFFLLFIVLYSSFANAQVLEEYLQLAEQNNPTIQAVELRYRIAEEKIKEANALPNTEISAGYFVSEPETRTGPQIARFSVRQMIPWFGTLSARKNYASAMADADYVEVTIAKRKTALSVAEAYYRLYMLQEKEEVLDKNIELLEVYETLALTSVEVGNASAVDILKLQIRQNELIQQKGVLLQTYLSEKNKFNQLLNREKEAPVPLVDTLLIPSEEIRIDWEKLEIHPELLKYDRLYESVTLSEALNQKEFQPNIGIGLDYVPVAEGTFMMPPDNGKDIVMPMISLSIPIFNTKYRSVTRQNELRQQEITAEKQERTNTLKILLQNAGSNLEAARLTYELQLSNLKQAKNAEEILMKNYETGTIDFNDLLEIQELQLKFEIMIIEAVQEFYQQAAVLNYLTQ